MRAVEHRHQQTVPDCDDLASFFSSVSHRISQWQFKKLTLQEQMERDFLGFIHRYLKISLREVFRWACKVCCVAFFVAITVWHIGSSCCCTFCVYSSNPTLAIILKYSRFEIKVTRTVVRSAVMDVLEWSVSRSENGLESHQWTD